MINNKELTVNELFSGIGSQRKALERLGVPHKVVGISEIDKYAIKSYEAMFGKTKNYGDVSIVDKLDYADFWTYSFPCQDISVSGKQAGIKKDKYKKITEYERIKVTGTTIETMEGSKEIYELVEKGTRSGLLYQVERLLNVAKEHGELPKYLMLENVKNLVGKKFRKQFDEWLEYLNELGYNNYWQVLNAKDYGIPQNRERVFVISIRKDIDDNNFEFPKAFDNGMRLKDILETEVNESFYIAQEKVDKMLSQIKNKDTLLFDVCQAKREEYFREYNDFSPTLAARDYKDPRLVNQSVNIIGKLSSSQDGVVVSQNGIAPTHTAGHGNCPKVLENKVKQIGNTMDSGSWKNPQAGRVYDSDGCCPTLNTMQGGDRQPKILQTPRGFNKGGLHDEAPTISSHSWECNNFLTEPCIAASRGRNPDNPSNRTTGNPTEQRLEINTKGISNTITTVVKDNYVVEPQVLRPERTEYGKQIRKSYEAGEVKESRHNMTTLQPRTDGISNCLTTVIKDNYVVEPKMLCPQRQYDEEGNRSVKHTLSDTCPTILATQYKSGDNQPKVCEPVEFDLDFRIRKLTPLECWRLMGFDDEDFYKAQKGINDTFHKGKDRANSQLYKQAGNSIVVDVLYYIFKNVFSDYITVEDTTTENFI